MEKAKNISKKDFRNGYFIELQCCMCHSEIILGGYNKKQLSESLKENEWKWLASDEYQLEGYWCGCNYK